MATNVPPRAPAIPEKEHLVGTPHLYESFKKIELWMQQASAWMANLNITVTATVTPTPTPPPVVPAPTVLAISPATGAEAGGDSVTITGTGFLFGSTVEIGGVEAPDPVALSPTTITATTPAHAAGAVDVVVTNPDGQTGTLTAGFTYATPTVAYILTQTPGVVHSDFDGYLGLTFDTGANTPTVYSLGRWKIAGNDQTHALYLYEFVDGAGADIQKATVTVDMTTGADADYLYGNLTTPVTLEAGKTYYVISTEVSFTDEWYDDTTTADSFTSGIGTLGGSVYTAALGSITGNAAAPATYIPVNFKVAA